MINKIFLALLISLYASNSIAQTDLEKGNFFFGARAENAKNLIAPTGNIDSAIFYLKRAYNLNKNEITATTCLRAYYFKSTHGYIEGDKRRKSILEEGKKVAEKYLEEYQKSARIHYWYAVLLGSWAKEFGVIAATKEGVIDKLKTECETVIRLDDKYDDGAGYRFLAILNLDVPYIPFILPWPDEEVAVELFEKAYKINSNNIFNLYYYAKGLNEVGNKEKSIKILEKAIKLKPRKRLYLEDKSQIILSQELYNDLTKK